MATFSKAAVRILKTPRGTIMRISDKAKELADLKYINHAQRISSGHYANIQRFEITMPRGGAKIGAIDKEHLEMAKEIAQTYADCCLESFIAEGLLPDANDLNEIKAEIENIIGRHNGNEFWHPRPSTSEALIWLPQQVFGRFAARVKQMQLERELQRPAQEVRPSVNQITIGGSNYGAIQQGGQGNTQILNEDKNEAK
jgi:hypothetical protein